MLRASVISLFLLTTPAFAFDIDASLKALFDRDGPSLTTRYSESSGGSSPSARVSQPEVTQEAADGCSGYDHNLPVDDPCSGWVVIDHADFGDGVQTPVYGHLDHMDPTTDSRCPPERFGSCPELLDPETFADWLVNNPDYDGPRPEGM
jgi:hypothetical protein